MSQKLEVGKFYGIERHFAIYSHTSGDEHIFLAHYPVETEAGTPVVKHAVRSMSLINKLVVNGEIKTKFFWPGDENYRELNRRFNKLIRK